MKVLVATDAWHPQVNGVVRTLASLKSNAEALGHTIEFLSPEGFPSFPVPTYPGLRCAIPRRDEIARRIEQAAPDAIHIATEGPIGLYVRRYCVRQGLAFTTSLTTRFAEYLRMRLPVPISWGYGAMRRFHAPAEATMVSTHSLMTELAARGFGPLKLWSRGVDTELFHPGRRVALDFTRPIFMNVGRVAVEKNLDAFLSLDLPGTKVVVGQGPHRSLLAARYPEVKFLGEMSGETLAAHFAAADVFVFPSRTDTFGLAQLEALASGVPVAAFPVPGPLDVITSGRVGCLDDDLRAACLRALHLDGKACRDHAFAYSWKTSAEQFISNLALARARSASQVEA